MRNMVVGHLFTVFLCCALAFLDNEGLFFSLPSFTLFLLHKPTGGKWQPIRTSSASYTSPVTN